MFLTAINPVLIQCIKFFHTKIHYIEAIKWQLDFCYVTKINLGSLQARSKFLGNPTGQSNLKTQPQTL